MKLFNAVEYGANVRFRKQDNLLYTFYVSEGFALDPFQRANRPWFPIDREEEGRRVHKNAAIIDFILPDGRVCRIPKGFEWDGASIPSWAQWAIGKPMGEYALAALLHDWLYASRILGNTRKGRLEADELFYTVMEQLDISWWRRKAMYRAVRLGGSAAYHKSDETAHCREIMSAEKYNPWHDYRGKFPRS